MDGETLVSDNTLGGQGSELQAGHLVGEYSIESKLGEGGFGVVYKAIHPVIGKAAAIKVLNPECSADPQMVARFVAEARAVNQIRHKGIIDIFSFGRLDDGRQYYIMELLDGVPLDAYVKRRGRLPPEEVLPILRQISRALDAAHGAGIAHRDLKPENVFVVFDDEGLVSIKLLDFGIAKLLGDHEGGQKTRSGALLGSPFYMSPEQCRGRGVDHRTDIYSLGVMACELLTGHLPFEGEDMMDLLMKQVNAPPPRPSTLCKDLAQELDQPVMQMLAKAPGARPSSVGGAVDALVAAAQSAGHTIPATALRSEVVRPVSDRGSASAPGARHDIGAQETVVAPEGVSAETRGSTPKTLVVSASGAFPAPSHSRTLVLVALVSLTVGILAALAFWTSSSATSSSEIAHASLDPLPPTPPGPMATSAAGGEEVASKPSPPSGEVVIVVQGNPPDLDISLNGSRLGSASEALVLQRSDDEVELLFSAKGYRTSTQKISPRSDMELEVKLVKETAPSSKPVKSRIHRDLSYD
ncbi:serine/threonine protein kinase [Chondromyces crocatus]|uniref:serine/threonine protein kinase n=1 Tax=Chondromyces crocatus TaxID=52 RepID=UPI0014701104|nr:serine/threonine-protein kinase [Chondromyces crocatus]